MSAKKININTSRIKSTGSLMHDINNATIILAPYCPQLVKLIRKQEVKKSMSLEYLIDLLDTLYQLIDEINMEKINTRLKDKRLKRLNVYKKIST